MTDPAGAVVPGVDITLVNTGTNQTRTVVTNGSGNYSAPGLPVGTYDLEASIAGFSTERRTGIALQIDQSARLNIALQVGTINQVVEGVAETPLLQTDESSIGSVIDAQKMLELPINGRNFDALIQLVPGAVTNAQGSELDNRGGFNIVGMDENFNSFFIDGFDNVDPVLRSFSFQPSVDLLQEFKVEQSSYAAEFGRNAGAVINATTRSGSNAFHGSIWEFLRNDNLDARNFFASGDADPALIRNQFGAAIGGPIVEDRTFFFAFYEGFREKRGDTRRATVPTLLMRDGNLSELSTPIIDPSTGSPFPGNIIPPDRMNAITRDVIQAYPLPNVSGVLVGNRIEVANHVQDSDDLSIRVDHRLFENTDMMARYSYGNARVLDPFWTDTPGDTNLKDFPQRFDKIRTNAGFSFTTTIGNNKVHEFRIGYNRFKQPQTPLRAMPANQAPLAGINRTFLDFRPSGLDRIGSNRVFSRVANVYNLIDQFSWFTGNHQLKFGVDLRRYYFSGLSAAANQFRFNGFDGFGRPQTGNGLADMFLGLPGLSISFGGDLHGNSHKTEFAGYIQDDWKVTPNLTLNYGLRWEWYGRIKEKNNQQSNWEPGCNCLAVAGQDASEQLVEDDWNNFAPRFGFAYRPFGSDTIVVRGGGGIFYDNQQRHNFFQISNSPFGETLIGVLSPIDDPFGGPVFPNVLPFGIPVNYRDTYAEHWNLGIQKEILPDTVLDVAWVGNHVLKAQRLRNVNSTGEFSGFGPILMLEQAGSSIFHSLQVRAERRFSNRLALISSYTWGHAIDDRPGEGLGSQGGDPTRPFQDNNNARADRADADFDVRHRYTLSFVYQLPATNYDGLAGHLLNDWGINGILILQGGRPFTIYLPNSSTRPDAVPGVDQIPSNQGPDNWINAAAFTAPAGPLGTLGRNTGRGPALNNMDLSFTKSFPFNEGRRLQFRTEIFNLTNTPNFGLPNQEFGAANFGLVSATSTTEWQIQFGLRYEF